MKKVLLAPPTLNKKNETKSLCSRFVNLLFGSAPKKKFCRSTIGDHMELLYYLAMINSLFYFFDFLKKKEKEGWTTDEILGNIQLDIKEVWGYMATSKCGYQMFQGIDLDTILKSKSVEEIIANGFHPGMIVVLTGSEEVVRVSPN